MSGRVGGGDKGAPEVRTWRAGVFSRGTVPAGAKGMATGFKQRVSNPGLCPVPTAAGSSGICSRTTFLGKVVSGPWEAAETLR